MAKCYVVLCSEEEERDVTTTMIDDLLMHNHHNVKHNKGYLPWRWSKLTRSNFEECPWSKNQQGLRDK